MNYTVDPTTLADYLDFALSRAYGTCVEILLYGVLLVLLAIATDVLYHRTTAGRRSLAAATCLMAILATLQLGIRIRADILRAPNPYGTLFTVEDFLLVTNNAVTDSLFVYRCFMIWGKNGHVMIIPVLMLSTTTVLGYLCAYGDDHSGSNSYINSRTAFLMSVLTNVVLMFLTASRIWWIRRDARVLGQSVFAHQYSTVITMILESGMIYCVTVAAYLISVSFPGSIQANSLVNSIADTTQPLTNVLRGAVPQMMDISPMLIIVRVGLGHSVGDNPSQDTPQLVPRTRATHGSATSTRSFILDIRAAHDIDAEPRMRHPAY
ncbi:hypothetical protein C8R44DRAFT_885002 [Mycena epipterygia]|nr:hypothetical protein C8R44DRAFT_885002 [Mycena epipterygia]